MTTSTKLCVCFIQLTFLFSNAVISSTSSDSVEGKNQVSLKTLIRNKRDELCSDGTYKYEGRTCCLCAAGQRVKDHCKSSTNTTCEFCENKKTYSDHPNSETFCKPCTSCDHPNANLETEEECTTAQDAKCHCKPNHFCSSNSTGMCKICQPCDTCASSGNELCARYCKEETTNAGAIVAGIFGSIVFAAVVVGVICWRKRSKESSADITSPAIPLLQVPVVDMQHLLPDIAKKLGWNNMKKIALRSGISQTDIETVRLNHPLDAEEMTLDLLGRWVESRGKRASQELIEMLQKSGKNDTAEKILEIYNNANPVASNSSV